MASPHAATPEEMVDAISGRVSTDPEWFRIGDRVLEPAEVVSVLESYVSDQRKQRLEAALSERTDDVAVVIEGMVDLGNVGAVMRSADGFGVQTVHAIDTADAYKRSRRSSQGADKWLDRIRWTEPAACVDHLHEQGFTVLAADISDRSVPIHDADLTGRVAVVFGNELSGISPEMHRLVDGHIMIPMAGFSESFNISVAAAVTLFEVRRQRIARFGRNGDLGDERTDQLRAVWYMQSVREPELLLGRLVEDQGV